MTFPTTRWDRVAEAGDPTSADKGEAIADLCRSYWYPIYLFIRSRGHSATDAADLTQDYFARLLQGRLFAEADLDKGRFRSLLLADCRHFLADHHDRVRTIKRGGRARVLSLDTADAEQRYNLEPIDRDGPESLFDRAWALEVLTHALDRLAQQEVEAGRGDAFEQFRPLLTEGGGAVPIATLAARLGRTTGAIEGAVRRLRGRYRFALRTTVAETLDHPDEPAIDEEIRNLFDALSR